MRYLLFVFQCYLVYVGSQFTSHSDLVAQPHTWVEVKWETLGPQPLRSA